MKREREGLSLAPSSCAALSSSPRSSLADRSLRRQRNHALFARKQQQPLPLTFSKRKKKCAIKALPLLSPSLLLSCSPFPPPQQEQPHAVLLLLLLLLVAPHSATAPHRERKRERRAERRRQPSLLTPARATLPLSSLAAAAH